MRKDLREKDMDFVKIREEYLSEFSYGEACATPYFTEQYHQFESEMLYAVIRHIKPSSVIEFSPNKGFTSWIIMKALHENGPGSRLFSFDIDPSSVRMKHSFDVERIFTHGDAIAHVPLYTATCDFMFIDSDHSYEFAQDYCREIIPDLEKGTIVFIHDWNERELLESKAVMESGLLRPLFNCKEYLITQDPEIGVEWSEKWLDLRSPTQILERI